MFVNPLYRWGAALLAVLAVVGVIYGKGRLDASYTAQIADLQRDLRVAEQHLETERNARVKDARAAAAQRARMTALANEAKDLNSYVAQLEDAHRVCLDRNGTDRLRRLWD